MFLTVLREKNFIPNSSLPRGWRAPSRATITKTKEPDLTVVGSLSRPLLQLTMIIILSSRDNLFNSKKENPRQASSEYFCQHCQMFLSLSDVFFPLSTLSDDFFSLSTLSDVGTINFVDFSNFVRFSTNISQSILKSRQSYLRQPNCKHYYILKFSDNPTHVCFLHMIIIHSKYDAREAYITKRRIYIKI